MITKLEFVNEVTGIETVSKSLLLAVINLAEDKQSRVRLATINEILLLDTIPGVTCFDEQLSELCMNCLSDKVFEIQQAATVRLKGWTECFGQDWARVSLHWIGCGNELVTLPPQRQKTMEAGGGCSCKLDRRLAIVDCRQSFGCQNHHPSTIS